MANRPKGFGMTAELANKRAAKYDVALANDSMQWVHDVLADAPDEKYRDPENAVKSKLEQADSFKKPTDVVALLKDGTILCHLINVIKADSVKKINTNNMAFKQMENITNFLKGCEAIGCQKADLFQTVDLYEGNNVPQVISGILALGRKAQTIGYDGPVLGPTESTENKREFTEEQMKAGQHIIGLQAGSNKGASQAGQNFGKTRAIID